MRRHEAFDEAEILEEQPETDDRREESSNLEVLVVEDDELNRQGTCELLTSEGWTTHAAANSAEALACSEESVHLDVAIVDMTLPDGDGEALVEKLRARRPELPVVFVSGVYQGEANLSERPDSLRTAYLQKPVEFERLLGTIDEVRTPA